jgi:SAM-dependent methyltransferase
MSRDGASGIRRTFDNLEISGARSQLARRRRSACNVKIVIPDFVVSAEREQGGVLVNSLTKEEVLLDEREMRLWKSLASTGDIRAAADAMLKRHDVSRDTLVKDLNTLLSRLVPRGMIRQVDVEAVLFGGWAPWPIKGTRLAGRIGRNARDLREWFGWWLDARFDRRFGTDTTGRQRPQELYLQGPSASDAVYYEATPTRVIRRALEAAVPDPERRVFVDYGSGKGRVLLLASDYPFKRVIGVELSGMLHITAQHNIRIYRGGKQRCPNVGSVCCDAARFDLPDDDLVIYFYTPFGGKVFEKVLENIRQCNERRPHRLIVIAYSSRRDQIAKIAAQPFARRQTEIPLRYEFTRLAQRRLYVFTNQ